MTNLPTKTTYQKLLTGIMAVHDRAMREVAGAVDRILKRAYWDIGRMIVEVEQKGNPHAPYGEHLLEELSKDLTAADRKGFSLRNLRNMRGVYQAFPIRQLTAELTWTHFVALSAIKDPKERSAYLKRAIRNNWNVEQLQEAVQPLITVEDEKPALPAASAGADVSVYRLAVKRGVPNLYRVAEPGNIPCDDKHILVDCGFFIYRKIPLNGAARPKPDEIIAMADTIDSVAFKRMDSKGVERSALYTYPALVERVIDGDTIVVQANCGFGLWSRQKLRLRKINAPEIKTAAGKKAKEFVQSVVKSVPLVVIKTYSTDIYDRFLVDVFYSAVAPGETDPAKVAAEGVLLNQELVNAGLAEIWRQPDPEELAFLN